MIEIEYLNTKGKELEYIIELVSLNDLSIIKNIDLDRCIISGHKRYYLVYEHELLDFIDFPLVNISIF